MMPLVLVLFLHPYNYKIIIVIIHYLQYYCNQILFFFQLPVYNSLYKHFSELILVLFAQKKMVDSKHQELKEIGLEIESKNFKVYY